MGDREPTFYLENLLDELKDLKSDGKLKVDDRLKGLQVILTQFVLSWVSERKSDHEMRIQGQENYLKLASDWNTNFAKLSDVIEKLSDKVEVVENKSVIIWFEKHPKLGALILALFMVLVTIGQDILKPLLSKWLGLPIP
jgi:predicted RecB family endonuclease